jgi:hypothetical protein
MPASIKPKILLVDEGELDLVRALLAELGADYQEIQASRARRPLPLPTTLLVTAAAHAITARLHRTRNRRPEEPSWLAFVEGESRMQSRLLRDAGFDLVVPDRVHPAALRLLLARGCFQGDDTQRVTRVAYGGEISFGSTLRWRKAIMIEISPRGCRFLTSKPPKPGSKFSIHVPRGHHGTLELEGHVVRLAAARQEGGLESETAVGFRFNPLKPDQVEQLKGLLIERLAGPLPLPSGAPVIHPVAPQPRFSSPLPPAAPAPTRPPAPLSIDEAPTLPALPARRPRVLLADASSPSGRGKEGSSEAPCAVFEREVSAICAGGTRVLFGRDLSEQGMRVEPHGRLHLGERVRIVIHAAAREEPLLVEAHVARDDGPRGILLSFDYMEPSSRARLRVMIEALPKIRRFGDDEVPTHTTYLTELLPAKKF